MVVDDLSYGAYRACRMYWIWNPIAIPYELNQRLCMIGETLTCLAKVMKKLVAEIVVEWLPPRRGLNCSLFASLAEAHAISVRGGMVTISAACQFAPRRCDQQSAFGHRFKLRTHNPRLEWRLDPASRRCVQCSLLTCSCSGYHVKILSAPVE